MRTTAEATPPSRPGRENADPLRAWKAFLWSHALLTRELDEELQSQEGLSLGDYDVLVALAGASRDRLAMCDLAVSVVLSRSGLTRRVDRLEQAGLVCRSRGENDARNVEASLTDAGRRRLRGARDTHRAGIDDRFQRRFNERELAVLAELLERLLEDRPARTAEL
jgi:DNA-binding MarR family transcriptional regulator